MKSKAPDFLLPGDDGQSYSLESFAGKKLLLYFYPKDNTAGCNLQAQEFSLVAEELASLGVLLVGVSRDSVKTHQNFKKKFALNFLLLSDQTRESHATYNCLVQKKMYGKEVTGVERSSFLIDEAGYLIHEWRRVNAAGHAAEVLSFVRQL